MASAFIGVVLSEIISGFTTDAFPDAPEVAPPPAPAVTKEDANVRQSAMMRKNKLTQASRSSARKNIVAKDTLGKQPTNLGGY